ncbi:MAG: RDD family protein [Bdellovibrio sp.]|nr:RDD family protein [Bdellovibrio sp.]
MVYSDISDVQSFSTMGQSNQNSGGQKPTDGGAMYKASIVDRFFSFLLDYLIFAPVVSFFLITCFQDEVAIWKSGQTRAENLPILFLLSATYIFTFSFLQSFFIYFWGGSPGQYFLKLRVHVDRQPGLIFIRILVRQVGFWFSALFLGLPWLAVLSHPKQKTFYDRISETSVYSLKQNQKFFSFEVETKYWRSLFATLVIFLFIICAGYGWQQHNQIKLGAYTFNSLNKKDLLCAQLKPVEIKDRLQTAVALNLVGQLSDDCVDKEAEYVLWTVHDDEMQSLAYYAKSLTESDSADEKRYLNQACQFKNKDYFGCRVASAFLNKGLTSLYADLKTDKSQKDLLEVVLQYELGMVLKKGSEEDENFKALRKFDKQRIVKKYLLSELLERRLAANRPIKNKGRMPASQSIKSTVSNPADFNYAQKLIEQM